MAGLHARELGEGILHKCLQSYAHLLPFDKKMHQNCFGDGYEGRRSFYRKDKLRQFGNCKNVVEYIKIIEPECRRTRFLTSDYVTKL